MRIKIQSVKTGLEQKVEGIIWYDEEQRLIVNTKPERYTFSNIKFDGVNKSITLTANSSMTVHLQGVLQVASGTGEVPELYNITLYLDTSHG